MRFEDFVPGAQASPPDPRDRQFDHEAVMAVTPFPAELDMRRNFGPVLDQGRLGSCLGHAAGSLYAYRMSRKHRGGLWEHPSRLAIYYWARRYANQTGIDAGATLRNMMKTLATEGAPAEELWPYRIERFREAPPEAAEQAGQDRQALIYWRVQCSVDAWKAALVKDLPVVFGMQLRESFFNPVNGVVPIPGPDERRAGGHALLAVGWSDARRAFLIRNSWGTSFGDGGYAWLPYEMAESAKHVFDGFTLSLVEG